jgi:hypothetical protein
MAWLRHAVCSVQQCMQKHQLSSRTDKQRLLDTLGQLLRQVLAFAQHLAHVALACQPCHPSVQKSMPFPVYIIPSNCTVESHDLQPCWVSCSGTMMCQQSQAEGDLPAPLQIIFCTQLDERAAAVGLWFADAKTPMAGCMVQLY